jgi:DNA-binding NtrC family response regulator
MEIERGCVYFFRHIGLTPVKIGYSSNESPISRFNQFRTYAPYGSEILGFVILTNAKEIETFLHQKYANKRLSGEWFEITIEDVQKEVDFYSNISDIEERNNFQIAWAKEINDIKNKVNNEIKENKKTESKQEQFIKKYIQNEKLNITHEANYFEVSRRCIYDWIRKHNESKKKKTK